MFDNHNLLCLLKHSFRERKITFPVKSIYGHMLGKLNIALWDVRNSKKAKKRKGVWSSTGQTYQLHTHTDASQALAPSTCCLSLAAGSCSFHSSFLIRFYQAICCLILALLKYFQRALWDKRHKALWKQASFSPIPSRTPVISQEMYICMIGAISSVIISFFKR